MAPERLRILFVSPLPPSPPRSGAQARMHGLATSLARRHEITAISLIANEFDPEKCGQAMSEYCRAFTLVPNPRARGGNEKRIDQLWSLLSLKSYERRRFSAPGFQDALDRVLLERPFDLVFLHFPSLAHHRFRPSSPGAALPPLVIDSHDIGYDLARQIAGGEVGLSRRVYGAINWRKVRREEQAAYASADGVCVCSAADQSRLAIDVPSARTVVVPNAADVDYFQPRAGDPPDDGRTVLFFGLLSTVPNVDGVLFFLKEIWPRISAARPQARCKIVGAHPPASVRAFAGPSVEVTGQVEDLRPHLAAASVVVVPLRLGSGTRLKIVEGWAMAKPIVSTALGAEGIEATPERDMLVADEPGAFASSVVRLLDDPTARARLGHSARRLAVERYSWNAAAARLESFFREVIAGRDRGR